MACGFNGVWHETGLVLQFWAELLNSVTESGHWITEYEFEQEFKLLKICLNLC